MTDTLPPPIERVRMAFAEIGYDPAFVYEPIHPELGSSFGAPRHWPDEVVWRAREAALIDDPRCFACQYHAWHQFDRALPAGPCDASRRFVLDCGRTRDEAS